jgi:glycosyltransferase involved in cell wall biosynthesis
MSNLELDDVPKTAIVHYAAPPVVGGVEGVIAAHVRAFVRAGYPITVITGRGDKDALPDEVGFIRIARIDTQHPEIAELNAQLREGTVPPTFHDIADHLTETLAPTLGDFDNLIVHNVFTKRFNLPLTAALSRLLDDGLISHAIAWCHDIGWTSDHSLPNLHSGHPWDLLRTYREDITYVAVSEQRRQALVGLFDCPHEEIRVVYNGVDPRFLLGLTEEGDRLIERLGLLESDLIILMPVRVTQAKNIELALHVVAALKARREGVKLILTGPPDPHDEESMAYFRDLQALRRELDVEDEMRFVFESGPTSEEAYTIGMAVVADLFRASDVVFMPSHREGFGMPVLEAGLLGKPIVCTEVPAAREIGGEDVVVIDPGDAPERIAERILSLVGESPVHRLRSRIRQEYTWGRIFERDIKPLLKKRPA